MTMDQVLTGSHQREEIRRKKLGKALEWDLDKPAPEDDGSRSQRILLILQTLYLLMRGSTRNIIERVAIPTAELDVKPLGAVRGDVATEEEMLGADMQAAEGVFVPIWSFNNCLL